MTLIAGVLLISVGMLAILPYVLKQGWRIGTGQPVGPAPVSEARDALGTSSSQPSIEASGGTGGVEELMAHLFSLRMTVSEIAAEVQEAHDILEGESSSYDTDRYGPQGGLNPATEVA